MATQLVAVASLLISAAFLFMANGLTGLLLPVRGTIDGFTTIQLGLLGTSWAVGFIAATLCVPVIVRRVGHIRSFGALASLSAIAILLNLLIIAPPAWIVLRALSGFCFAGAAMIVESWLNERADSTNRGKIFSIYQTVNFVASTAGQLLLTFSAPAGFALFVVGAILYCLAILPTALSATTAPRPIRTTRLDLRGIYASSPVAAVGCLLVGLVNGAFGTLGPVYAQQIGLPIRDVAILMAGAFMGGALIQYPVGWISDKTDRRRVMIAIAIGAFAIAATLVTLRPHTPLVVTSFVVIYGAMMFPMYAVIIAHANDFADSDDFTMIASGLLLLYGIGTFIGPAVAALVMDRIAPEGLFAFTAFVHLLFVAFTLLRIFRRTPGDPLQRGKFRGMPLPKTLTPESAVLDPRARLTESNDDPGH